MDFGHLKQTNLNALLPKGIKDSLVCYTITNSKVVAESPDIITCHRNGCIYEIKNKKIIRSLNLNETASSVRCCYLSENEKIVVFYLVVQDYDRVKDFQVYDFQCLGFPQIKITLLNDGRNLICNFPVESNDEANSFENSSVMADSLVDELQILNTHIDELTEEYNQLKKICFFSNKTAGFDNVFVDSVAFSLPLDEAVQPKLTVSSKWLKVFGNFLILGMKICSVGGKVINDLEVTINHKKIKDYSYSIFQSFNDFGDYLFSAQVNTRFVKPSQQIYVVVTFPVPEFFIESEFVVPFCITCSDFQRNLLKDTFEVKIQDVACGTTDGLEEQFTVEDLMALKVIKTEIHVRIRTDDLKDCSVESILMENLGFKRIKHVKDKLFYCTSTYLREVFVALRHITVNPSVWKLLILSSERSQLYFLVNALYDLLPENTSILLDEH